MANQLSFSVAEYYEVDEEGQEGDDGLLARDIVITVNYYDENKEDLVNVGIVRGKVFNALDYETFDLIASEADDISGDCGLTMQFPVGILKSIYGDRCDLVGAFVYIDEVYIKPEYRRRSFGHETMLRLHDILCNALRTEIYTIVLYAEWFEIEDNHQVCDRSKSKTKILKKFFENTDFKHMTRTRVYIQNHLLWL